MAGADATGAFDPDEYRANIRAARQMGFPVDVAMQPTFHFAKVVVNASADEANRPWDFQQPKSADTTPDPIVVLCGITVDKGGSGYTGVGRFDAEVATLAFFEDEWDLIGAPAEDGGFEHVFIGGNRYERGKTLKPGTLFDVTTHRVQVIAKDT